MNDIEYPVFEDDTIIYQFRKYTSIVRGFEREMDHFKNDNLWEAGYLFSKKRRNEFVKMIDELRQKYPDEYLVFKMKYGK